MAFLSPAYFLFFPLVVLGYFLLPQRARNAWLLAASWYFYLCAGPQYFVFLLGTIVLTYAAARGIERKTGRSRRALLLCTLLVLFGALFLLKYLGFALGVFSRALGALGVSWEDPALALILPAGISFYLFQAAGYLIDVYRGTRAAERRFLPLALFLSFFPQLLSGPIARAETLLPQFAEKHCFDYDALRTGLLRFLWGAFQKLVLADRLAVLVNTVFAAPETFGSLQLAAAAVAFSIQIYCDFSAYSDMAIGCAEVMGFRLMENFRTPYFSRSIGAFWRRWHISLSSWFRDYLYIPLGGGRRGTARKYRNVLLVFAVSGLWHGAALTFLVWGLLNGLYQVIGGLTARGRAKLRQCCHLGDESAVTKLLQIAITFALTTVAWVFFKADSLRTALLFLVRMVTAPAFLTPIYVMGLGWQELLVAALAFLLLLAVDLSAQRGAPWARLLAKPRLLRWGAALGLLLAVFLFGTYGTGYDPQAFLYFRF